MTDSLPAENQITTQRLDVAVHGHMRGKISRVTAAKLIREGRVKVNGRQLKSASFRLRPDDRIEIDDSILRQDKVLPVKLKVIYEDSDCVAINKPSGILSHAKGEYTREATVASWLQSRLTGSLRDDANNRSGIVHRLDRATSGVMIAAKTIKAQHWLQKQFANRQVLKIYLAVVNGIPAKPEAIIDMPIERNPRKPSSFRVGVNGKTATTRMRVVRSGSRYSLIELIPATGRTHQLRVHLKAIGHPIVGDSLYGGEAADRLYLHAQKLAVTLPSGKKQSFTAPLPISFNKLVNE